jgi:WXG100 family type VII secretion target
MATANILVTFAALEDATQDLNQTRAALDQRLDELRSFLAQLNVTWVGGAHEAYTGYQEMWNESYRELNQILARIGVLLAQKNADYMSTEQANMGAWG